VVVVVGLASLAPNTKPASVNEPPVAQFDFEANNLTVVFNASASSDPDGSIANYSWTFGDNTLWYGQVVNHSYPANGTYVAALTVTDNGGAKNTTSKDVTVEKTAKPPVTSKPPTAVLKIVSIVELSVSVSGDRSTSAPGTTIASYAWTFGDGASTTGIISSHTYASAGVYDITLTVTDSVGAKDSASVEVVVSVSPPVTKPTPVIEIVSIENLTVVLSGFNSTPAQGTTIASYAWFFGDGTTGTGANVTHTYERNGTYTVTLTVTDSDGGKNSTSVQVAVSTSAPPPPHPHPDGPPGLLHAIEIHMEKAGRNGGLSNSLHHLQENLDRWLDKFGTSP